MKKVWFITGCSKGFGWQLVDELLKNTEDFVVATARTLSSLENFEKQYENRFIALPLDVTNERQIKEVVQKTKEKFGRIDVLVNNAGYGLAGALEECPFSEIRAIFETNVFGLMAITKAVLPLMRQQKQGHIINLSSIAGLVSAPGLGLYNSTKFAVEGLSEALFYELADFGIHVTLIEPGPFRTDFAGGSVKTMDVHPDYVGTSSDNVRKYLKDMNQHQPGDPQKAAQIIIQIAHLDSPPLRVPLGSLAIERIMKKFPQQLDDFKKMETLAKSADFS